MTLRAPRPPQIQRPAEEAATVNDYKKEQPPTATINPLLLVAGAVFLIGLSLVVFMGLGRTAPPPIPTPLAASTVMATKLAPLEKTVVVTATPVPTPDCVSASTQLALIESLAGKGDWEGAAREANAALAIVKLCNSDRKRLSEKAVAAGLQVLYNQKFEPLDEKSHQQVVDTFLALRERAQLSGVDFPTPLQVARTSYTISQFRLTVAAVEIALSEGDYNPQLDRDTTRLYISALYSLGYWYTQDQTREALFAEGLSYLSASYRLALKFKTGQGEAAMLLARLVNGDEHFWPAPYHSPLLDK